MSRIIPKHVKFFIRAKAQNTRASDKNSHENRGDSLSATHIGLGLGLFYCGTGLSTIPHELGHAAAIGDPLVYGKEPDSDGSNTQIQVDAIDHLRDGNVLGFLRAESTDDPRSTGYIYNKGPLEHEAAVDIAGGAVDSAVSLGMFTAAGFALQRGHKKTALGIAAAGAIHHADNVHYPWSALFDRDTSQGEYGHDYISFSKNIANDHPVSADTVSLLTALAITAIPPLLGLSAGMLGGAIGARNRYSAENFRLAEYWITAAEEIARKPEEARTDKEKRTLSALEDALDTDNLRQSAQKAAEDFTSDPTTQHLAALREQTTKTVSALVRHIPKDVRKDLRKEISDIAQERRKTQPANKWHTAYRRLANVSMAGIPLMLAVQATGFTEVSGSVFQGLSYACAPLALAGPALTYMQMRAEATEDEHIIPSSVKKLNQIRFGLSVAAAGLSVAALLCPPAAPGLAAGLAVCGAVQLGLSIAKAKTLYRQREIHKALESGYCGFMGDMAEMLAAGGIAGDKDLYREVTAWACRVKQGEELRAAHPERLSAEAKKNLENSLCAANKYLKSTSDKHLQTGIFKNRNISRWKKKLLRDRDLGNENAYRGEFSLSAV